MEYIAENGKALTDEVRDSRAAEYEGGTWSGNGEVSRGRRRMYEEEMETVSCRSPKSRVDAIEAVAKKRGESKSDFFRDAVDRALLAQA